MNDEIMCTLVRLLFSNLIGGTTWHPQLYFCARQSALWGWLFFYLLSRMWHYKLFSTTLVLSGELKSSFFVKLNHQAFWHNGKEFSNTCTFFFQQTQNEKHASNIAALFGFLCLTRDFMLLSSNVFWNLRRCHDDVKLSRWPSTDVPSCCLARCGCAWTNAYLLSPQSNKQGFRFTRGLPLRIARIYMRTRICDYLSKCFFLYMFQVTPSRWNPLYIHYMLQYPLNNGDGVMGPFFGELFPSFSLGTSVFDLDFCDPTKNWIQDCCVIPKPRKSPCQPDSQTKGWDIGSLSSNYLTQLIILIPTILGDGGLSNLEFGYSLTNPKYIISQMNMWKFRRDTSEVVCLRCVLIKLYESCLFAVNLEKKSIIELLDLLVLM